MSNKNIRYISADETFQVFSLNTHSCIKNNAILVVLWRQKHIHNVILS